MKVEFEIVNVDSRNQLELVCKNQGAVIMANKQNKQYCIMRVEKVKGGKAHINSLEKEHCRTTDDEEAMREKNPDIDWEQTEFNYAIKNPWGHNYAGDRGRAWNDVIDEQLTLHGITKTRKDAVKMLDGLYTASPEWFESASIEEQEAYFRDCVDFHERYFGKVISARVHLDEATPHLQVVSIPITSDDRLSAKEIIGNRSKMSQRQTNFWSEVGQKYGLERGEIKEPGQARQHENLASYKRKQEQEKLRSTEVKARALIEKLTKVSNSKNRYDLQNGLRELAGALSGSISQGKGK